MTFSVLFTFTDFQLIYVLTRGGPLNATHLMATLSFQRAISGGALGEGAAISIAMVPFLLAAILFSYFGLQRRAWQQGGRTNERRHAASDATRATDDRASAWATSSRRRAAASRSTCRSCVFVFVLLFPFYWMAITVVQARTTSCCRATAIRSG